MTTTEQQDQENPALPHAVGVPPASAETVEREVASVRHRVQKRFGDAIPIDVIDAAVEAQAARWAGAKVRTFVPLLVERYSVEGLRRMSNGASSGPPLLAHTATTPRRRPTALDPR